VLKSEQPRISILQDRCHYAHTSCCKDRPFRIYGVSEALQRTHEHHDLSCPLISVTGDIKISSKCGLSTSVSSLWMPEPARETQSEVIMNEVVSIRLTDALYRRQDPNRGCRPILAPPSTQYSSSVAYRLVLSSNAFSSPASPLPILQRDLCPSSPRAYPLA
jgi:hypothetical protein